MPCLRQMSAVFMPAWPSARIIMICSSVNLLFMGRDPFGWVVYHEPLICSGLIYGKQASDAEKIFQVVHLSSQRNMTPVLQYYV